MFNVVVLLMFKMPFEVGVASDLTCADGGKTGPINEADGVATTTSSPMSFDTAVDGADFDVTVQVNFGVTIVDVAGKATDDDDDDAAGSSNS